MCIYTTLCDLLSTHTDSPDICPTTSPDNIILLPVLAVVLLLSLLITCTIILLVRWRFKITQADNDVPNVSYGAHPPSVTILDKDISTSPNVSYGAHPPSVTVLDKDISTSPNVSYGAHPPSVTVLEDPLYESIHNQQLYEVACPPDDLTEYYVNEGLGPN